jgi:hypothetical protein
VRSQLDLIDELAAVVRELNSRKVPYAICGGLAVVVYGYVRATKDIDLLVERASVEPVFQALKGLGFGLRAGPIPFSQGTPQERELHRATKVAGTDHLTIDLLVVTPVLSGAWSSVGHVQWNGLDLPIVSKEGLAEMKRLAGRPQDLADLDALGVKFEP